MISNREQKGFTLIELLVVIAIIGILSSVVLASLNDARASAKDAAIKQSMRALAQTMEIEWNKSNTYIAANEGWFGSPTSARKKCATEGFSGSAETQATLRELCLAIEKNTPPFTGTRDYFLLMRVNTYSPAGSPMFSYTTDYSFATILNNGNWFCIGSSGKTYEGVPHPGTGPLQGDYNYWGGAGCYANP